AVGLEMRRRFVEAVGGAVSQLERIQGGLAADREKWTADVYPALVGRPALVERNSWLVPVVVVDANDASLDADAVGNPKLTLQSRVQQPAQVGLTVTWRTENEQASPRADRHAADLKDVVGQHQVADGRRHLFRPRPRATRQLPLQHCRVRSQRHGGRA